MASLSGKYHSLPEEGCDLNSNPRNLDLIVKSFSEVIIIEFICFIRELSVFCCNVQYCCYCCCCYYYCWCCYFCHWNKAELINWALIQSVHVAYIHICDSLKFENLAEFCFSYVAFGSFQHDFVLATIHIYIQYFNIHVLKTSHFKAIEIYHFFFYIPVICARDLRYIYTLVLVFSFPAQAHFWIWG